MKNFNSFLIYNMQTYIFFSDYAVFCPTNIVSIQPPAAISSPSFHGSRCEKYLRHTRFAAV